MLYELSGARYKLSGARYKLSGARYKLSGARYKLSGARYKLSGARYKLTKADRSEFYCETINIYIFVNKVAVHRKGIYQHSRRF
jgi:hypothetical protein